MKPDKLAILNSLVTFAAENVPGGLSEDEKAVALIVGSWALIGEEVKDVSPIPVTTKNATKIHYLSRADIHQTVCGLSTRDMKRFFSADIGVVERKGCAKCSTGVDQAAKL